MGFFFAAFSVVLFGYIPFQEDTPKTTDPFEASTGRVDRTITVGTGRIVLENGIDPAHQALSRVLSNSEFLENLRLTVDQEVRIKQASEDVGRFKREYGKELKKMTPESPETEVRQAIKNALQNTSLSFSREINGILNKKQQKLMYSSIVKEMKKQIGIKGLFSSSWLKSYLGMTNQEVRDFQKMIQTEEKILKEDIKAMIAEMTAQSELRLIDSLNPEQQKKYKALFDHKLR